MPFVLSYVECRMDYFLPLSTPFMLENSSFVMSNKALIREFSPHWYAICACSSKVKFVSFPIPMQQCENIFVPLNIVYIQQIKKNIFTYIISFFPKLCLPLFTAEGLPLATVKKL